MNLENRPSMLVEMHMLKDYKTRVTGNYELLRALLQVVNRDADKLIALNAAADREAEQLGAHPLGNVSYPLRLAWSRRNHALSLSRIQIHARAQRGLRHHVGAVLARAMERVAAHADRRESHGRPPCLPPPTSFRAQWTQVIDVLAAHQVVMQRTTAAWTAPVETYRCNGWQLATASL